MFQELKKRLVLLYGTATSIILTIIICIIYFLSLQQTHAYNRTLFENTSTSLIEYINASTFISGTWLANTQEEHSICIQIEENKIPFTSYSQYNMPKDQSTLIKKLKKKAADDSMNLDENPLSTIYKKTPVYTLYQSINGSYQGFGATITIPSGFRSILIIQYLPFKKMNLIFPVFLLILDFLGIGALFFVSSLYIGKVLKPLVEGQKKQTAFIASASHELRSPLTVIQSGIASINEDITTAPAFLPHITKECLRMSRLISDLLFLASSDAKTWPLKPSPMDMDTFLIEFYDMLCICYEQNGFSFRLELPDENLKTISGDKERLKQLLNILIDNAMAYTPKETEINLTAFNLDHFVEIQVKDHGPGIPDAVKEHIFDRFYRQDTSHTDKQHFGLGLSIAKELALLHGGKLYVKDNPEGGCIFSLLLPIYKSSPS